MKKWQPLKVGDIVDVVAPGFSTTDEKLKAGVEFLEKLGLKPRVPKDIFGSDVVCANSDEKRFAQFKAALNARDSKAVWCIRAGYGAIRLADKIAKMPKPKTPKLFIGYSDACTIHNLMNQFWQWPSVHGPLLDKLGQHVLPLDDVNEMVEVLFGVREKVHFKKLEPMNAAARAKKKITGAVAGGNLVVMRSHLGTKLAKPPKGQILVFEETGERGYRVDRDLFHLEMAGYFKGVKAFVFGDFIGGQEPGGESIVPAVLERFAQAQKIPVFRGLEIGHGNAQRILPLGTAAVLQCGATGVLTVESGAALK